MADEQHNQISLENARREGLSRYFTGKPCKRGHICERRTSTRVCIECSKIATLVDGRLWKKKNREHFNELQRKFYASHREQGIQQRKEYRSQNLERLQAAAREWKKNNKERVYLINRNRALKKKGVNGSHTIKDIKEILKMQQNKCALCRTSLKSGYHKDHIIPLSKGGSNARSNLQLLCAPCNLSKAARDPIVHAQSLGLLL